MMGQLYTDDLIKTCKCLLKMLGNVLWWRWGVDRSWKGGNCIGHDYSRMGMLITGTSLAKAEQVSR